MSALNLIADIKRSERIVADAKRERDAAYKAFADYVYQRIKRNGINRRDLRDYMGWKEHTLGNFLKQGDRLSEAEMLKLVDAIKPERRTK